MSVSTSPETTQSQHVPAAELERLLGVQRVAFIQEGPVTAGTRRDRVSRLAVAILENIDEIGEALSADYGHRPPALAKAFEATSWVADVQETLTRLDDWMAPVPVVGGYVQQKPKGVVGVIGAWNFSVILSFEPAMATLAAGNRVARRREDQRVHRVIGPRPLERVDQLLDRLGPEGVPDFRSDEEIGSGT
jgi:coniferyl-aldehyde dehydrogenase